MSKRTAIGFDRSDFNKIISPIFIKLNEPILMNFNEHNTHTEVILFTKFHEDISNGQRCHNGI